MDSIAADEVWASLSALFVDEDDNPLPEIQLRDVRSGAAADIWARIVAGAVISPDATVWLTAEQREVVAHEAPDLAARAERGEISSLHVVVAGATAGGIVLPDFGVSIDSGTVTIDYRVNVWDPPTAAAFLALLIELQALAPGSHLVAADEAGHAYDDQAQARLASAIRRVASA